MDISAQHLMLCNNIRESSDFEYNSDEELANKPALQNTPVDVHIGMDSSYLNRPYLSPFSKHISNKQRRLNNHALFVWLEDNYQLKDDECLARSVMYNHYLDYCKRSKIFPVSPASFGKIIKQKFPELKTRRLGTRGQSKYHYYGVSIKQQSLYYRSSDHKNGLSRFSTSLSSYITTSIIPKSKKENCTSCFPSVKLRTPLPDFPDTSYLDLKPNTYKNKLDTFMIMYRTHCQRIMDSVIRANFEEVNDLMVHFWQGMPQHMLEVLNYSITLHIITVCDVMLYRVLGEVLIPASLQALPDSLLSDIKDFAINIKEWLFEALSDLPPKLMIRKIELAKNFSKILLRQTTLVMLAQTARGVLRNCDSVSQMLEDWRTLDFCDISLRLTFVKKSRNSDDNNLVRILSIELESLFIKQAPLDLYLEWIDSMINSLVVMPAGSNIKNFKALSRQVMLEWFFIGRIIEEEMTIKSAPSFGCFRLLYLMLSEYIFFIIEHLIYQKIEKGYEDVLREIFIAHNPHLQPLDKIPTRNIEIIVPGNLDLSPETDEPEITLSDECEFQRPEPKETFLYHDYPQLFPKIPSKDNRIASLIGYPTCPADTIQPSTMPINIDYPSPIIPSIPLDQPRGVFRFDFPRQSHFSERIESRNLSIPSHIAFQSQQATDSSDACTTPRHSPTCFHPTHSLISEESMKRQNPIVNELYHGDIPYHPPAFEYSGDECYSHSEMSDIPDPPITQGLFQQKQLSSFHSNNLQGDSIFPQGRVNKLLHPSPSSLPYVISGDLPQQDHALQPNVLNAGSMVTSARLVYPTSIVNHTY
ncbi:transcription factor RFX4 [Oopsacas minuta]|uniref:DNA-binding protein RFX6 n=1 Tax=Oopsacas minuta TaxID=111878 RepID=A0AAV7JNX6_9METZ|nr:transcription factor RFX4 [Oopsacas minuta]